MSTRRPPAGSKAGKADEAVEAVEAAGGEAPLGACLDLVRKGGWILQVGLPGGAAKVNLDLLAWKEVQVVGTFGQKRSAWPAALRLMVEEKVDMEPMVSGILPLDEWRGVLPSWSVARG